MFPELDENTMTVTVDGMCRHLTPKEFYILDLLVSNPNKTFSPDEIYRNVWKQEPFQTNGMIAVHLRHIREKIEADPSRPVYIKSLWGKGYRYNREISM